MSERKQGWDKLEEGVLTLPISARGILQMPDGPGKGGGIWEMVILALPGHRTSFGWGSGAGRQVFSQTRVQGLWGSSPDHREEDGTTADEIHEEQYLLP